MESGQMRNMEGLVQLAPVEDGRRIGNIFCCDLLSHALVKLTEQDCWVTVVANMNTVAVAVNAGCCCVVLADGVQAQPGVVEKAVQMGLGLYRTQRPAFQTALQLYTEIQKEDGR